VTTLLIVEFFQKPPRQTRAIVQTGLYGLPTRFSARPAKVFVLWQFAWPKRE
jgi:hypothetical protein